MLTLHYNAQKERNPQAVVAMFKVPNGDPNFHEETIPGDWYRVFPTTCRDVEFLQMLDHRVDKFAPASGVGVFIHPRVLTPRRN